MPGERVEVRFRRDNATDEAQSDCYWGWSHKGVSHDIIAYRLVTPSSDGGCGSLPASPSVPTEQAETPVVGDPPAVRPEILKRLLVFAEIHEQSEEPEDREEGAALAMICNWLISRLPTAPEAKS